MKKSILIAIAAVVVIVVVVAGVLVWTNPFAGQPAATPTPPPNADVAVEARDAAVMFIATNHTDVSSMLTNLTWTGGIVETGLVGSETHSWTSGLWNATITHPVVLDPTYTISVVYDDTATKVTITWIGTYKDGVVTETSYNFVTP